MTNLTCMLLTGGLSRRMGTDKATLLYQGEPLWSHQLRTLSELRPSAIWLSARATPAWAAGFSEVVLDAAPSRGPLSGIAAALSRLKLGHLLVLAIDLPHMTAPHLRQLLDVAEPGRGVIPMKQGRYETVCAIYPVEAAAVARQSLLNDQLSLQDFVGELLKYGLLSIYDVKPSEEAFYLNLNTPADLTAPA